MYEFAESRHPDTPAEIEVGKPHDLNPSSYEDTKKIIRNESKKAGVSKYGNGGERSWLAIVCDGAPYKLFLSLVHVLYFCTSCKLPCGELKKHIEEVHGGKKDSIRMEFDHVLPLCGPGHVEKNILSAAITVLWDLIGLEKIAAICNFKSKAQHDMLKKVKDHHISADFLIICLQTLAKEICFEFLKEWCKNNEHIPTVKDLKAFFSPGSKCVNVNLANIFFLVNGPMLSTFLLRVGVRCNNGPLYYGAMSDCLSLLFHNKSSNYIRMLNFELHMVNNAPDVVQEFIFKNLFQRNQNHNNQNTAQGIDYKLEEFNKLFKEFEVSTAPSIEEWTKIASAAPLFKKIIENQSKDYNVNYGLYSEPGAPNYNERIEACSKVLRENEVLKSNTLQSLQNLDGKMLKKSETINYEKDFKIRRAEYLEKVTENNSFIKAELDFAASVFIDE